MSKTREIELPLLCEEPKEDDFSPLFEVPLRNEELTSVAKERLKLLNKNRRRNESLFPLVKKKSKLSYNSKVSVNRRISDVYDFLDSESPDDINNRPEIEEAAFIIRCFRDPKCQKFKPPGYDNAHSNHSNHTDSVDGSDPTAALFRIPYSRNHCNCSVCGLPEEFHEDRYDQTDGRKPTNKILQGTSNKQFDAGETDSNKKPKTEVSSLQGTSATNQYKTKEANSGKKSNKKISTEIETLSEAKLESSIVADVANKTDDASRSSADVKKKTADASRSSGTKQVNGKSLVKSPSSENVLKSRTRDDSVGDQSGRRRFTLDDLFTSAIEVGLGNFETNGTENCEKSNSCNDISSASNATSKVATEFCADGSGEELSTTAKRIETFRPALTFGSVLIPMRFVRRVIYASSSKEQCTKKYLKFDSIDAETHDKINKLYGLMTTRWDLPPPTVVISVTGGKVENQDFSSTFAKALRSLANQTDLWIISDGRNDGTSQYLGKLFLSSFSQAGNGNQKLPVFVGTSHWGSLDRKDYLTGITIPSDQESSHYFYSMEYKLGLEENYRVLNPFQSIYLLLDNGSLEPGECIPRYRQRLEDFLKKTAARKVYHVDVELPIVTFVMGGDEQTLAQVIHSVEHKNPVIVVSQSGKIPDLLANLYYNLESEFSRTWMEKHVWTKEEERVFMKYIQKYASKIRGIFTCVTNQRDSQYNRDRKNEVFFDVLKKLKNIMLNRFYVTIIDKSLETDDSLYGSMLQGIYKGYDRKSGMAIALKSGTYDFLQALLQRVDTQFAKEHFIDIHTLNYFYQEYFCQQGPMLKVLRLMCKRESIIKTIDANLSVLPVIGRILHLLLGPRYKIMYHEDEYLDFVSKDVSHKACLFKSKKDQMFHLFLWSVLSAKPEMTQFFITHTAAPLGATLLAFKLYSKLAKCANQAYEEELTDDLNQAAEYFQKLSIDLLDNMYNDDANEAYQVLASELPFELGPSITPLVIADDSQAMDFMSHSCCQTYLQRVWKGNMAVETPVWKSMLFMLPWVTIPWIHFEEPRAFSGKINNSVYKAAGQEGSFYSTPRQLSVPGRHYQSFESMHELNGPQLSTFFKIKSYYTAPVTKFYMRMCSYLCFLGVLSYFVLTDLKPFFSIDDISPAEWIVMIWVVALVVEEFVQLSTVPDEGPLYQLSNAKFNKRVWHVYEQIEIKLNAFALEIYITEGSWNGIDLAMVTLSILSFSLRFSLSVEYFQLDRIFFALLIIVCYFRLLRYWYVLHSIGPRIIAIQMMLTELLKFLLVLAVFIVSFGIAFQAILHPNQKPSWTTLVDIVWRPYWQMFGELYLDDDGMGRTVDDAQCIHHEDHVNENETSTVTNMECFQWATPVLLGIYLLIANVLLLNLLIAIFSQAYEDVQTKSHTVWLFNLYSLIQEFYYLDWVPPPFSLFSVAIRVIHRCVVLVKRRRNPDYITDGKNDCFRQPKLPPEHDLQKKACRDIKPYYSSSGGRPDQSNTT